MMQIGVNKKISLVARQNPLFANDEKFNNDNKYNGLPKRR